MSMIKGLDKVVKDFKLQIRNASRRIETELAQGQIVNMRQRLQSGIGVNDGPMPPYTPKYAKQKGRSGPRDLLVTGSMLRAMIARRNGHAVDIVFANAKEARKAFYNHQRYPWFGVSPKDRAKLASLLQRIAAQL